MLYEFEGNAPEVGPGTYISDLASIIGNVRLGSNCYVGHGAILRGDYCGIEVGDGTAVEEGVIVHAPPGELSIIGNKVTLGHGAIIHSRSIGDHAVIGMGTILSIWSEVGDRSIIAEGAVVKMKQKVPSGGVVAGNPGQVVRELSAEDKEFWDMGKQLYIDLAKQYLNSGMHSLD